MQIGPESLTSAEIRLSRSVVDDVLVLRLVGLVLVLIYTCVGTLLLVQAQGATRMIGLLLAVTGFAWLTVDVLRRRRVI